MTISDIRAARSVRPKGKWNRKTRRTRKGWRCGTARAPMRSHRPFSRNPIPSPWSTVRAQPMICLDRRLILSSPVFICVACVFCGSNFLAYCRHSHSQGKWNRKTRRTRKGWRCGTARAPMRSHRPFSRNPIPSPWSTVRAQPMIRLDRKLILSSPVFICVFCVFCGSNFLAYCRHSHSQGEWNRKTRRTRKG